MSAVMEDLIVHVALQIVTSKMHKPELLELILSCHFPGAVTCVCAGECNRLSKWASLSPEELGSPVRSSPDLWLTKIAVKPNAWGAEKVWSTWQVQCSLGKYNRGLKVVLETQAVIKQSAERWAGRIRAFGLYHLVFKYMSRTPRVLDICLSWGQWTEVHKVGSLHKVFVNKKKGQEEGGSEAQLVSRGTAMDIGGQTSTSASQISPEIHSSCSFP